MRFFSLQFTSRWYPSTRKRSILEEGTFAENFAIVYASLLFFVEFLLYIKRDDESAPTKGKELGPDAPESNALVFMN